jgi:hypothetical protein
MMDLRSWMDRIADGHALLEVIGILLLLVAALLGYVVLG